MNNSNTIIARIYRETIGRAGAAGIPRQDAFEEATALIQQEINAGRLELDVEAAIRAQLTRVDEQDGNRADTILQAAAKGNIPLSDDGLDLVVTLGAGHRKQWEFVTIDDLDQMNEIRYANYTSARLAYQSFRNNVSALRPVLFEYGTFGDAFRAGGFPPAGLFDAKAA